MVYTVIVFKQYRGVLVLINMEATALFIQNLAANTCKLTSRIAGGIGKALEPQKPKNAATGKKTPGEKALAVKPKRASKITLKMPAEPKDSGQTQKGNKPAKPAKPVKPPKPLFCQDDLHAALYAKNWAENEVKSARQYGTSMDITVKVHELGVANAWVRKIEARPRPPFPEVHAAAMSAVALADAVSAPVVAALADAVPAPVVAALADAVPAPAVAAVPVYAMQVSEPVVAAPADAAAPAVGLEALADANALSYDTEDEIP